MLLAVVVVPLLLVLVWRLGRERSRRVPSPKVGLVGRACVAVLLTVEAGVLLLLLQRWCGGWGGREVGLGRRRV